MRIESVTGAGPHPVEATGQATESDLDHVPAGGLVAVPDLDGGPPISVLSALEVILVGVSGWEDLASDEGVDVELPLPFGGTVALRTVYRLQEALRPTQSVGVGSGRLLAPDGRYEHRPLVMTVIAPEDVTRLDEVAQALGEAHPPEWLLDSVDDNLIEYHGYESRGHIAEQTAHLGALLRAGKSVGDVELLAPALMRVMAGEDVVLQEAMEVAYQRVDSQLNSSAGGGGSNRWLY